MLRALGPDRFAVFGLRVKRSGKRRSSDEEFWNILQDGDIVLFYRGGRISHLGKVVHKDRNADLARFWWGVSPEGDTWELLYFLKDFVRKGTTMESFCSLFGMKPYIPQRFQTVKMVSAEQLLPRYGGEPEVAGVDVEEPPARTRITISRIVRDTEKSRRLKQEVDYTCQVCGTRISYPDGKGYAEAHHLKPLGKEHRGLDSEENMLVLCPNHHAEFDLGLISLDLDGMTVIHIDNQSPWHKKMLVKHRAGPSKSNVEYHFKNIFLGA
jgi:hypothetical protein